MEIAIIITVLLLVGFGASFKWLTGEKERIRRLLREYNKAKIFGATHNLTEREVLGFVAGEFYPRGSTKKLKEKMSGQRYIDEVFGSREIDIKELIYHIISLEFRQKYNPMSINIEEIKENNRTGKLSKRDELKILIEDEYNKFFN